ncbi:hypothetical protein [Lentzea albidocapillata]|nr:hypothetical protein [Lentzea albidocapillata]
MRAGDKRSEISAALPAERRTLAIGMNALYEHVKRHSADLNSQAALTSAILIAEAGYLGATEQMLCKYLAGKHVPSEKYLTAFHRVISAETADHPAPLTLENLLDLRHRAASTDRRLSGVRKQEHELATHERAATERALEDALQRLSAMSAEKSASSALPVPPAEGDRQSSDLIHGSAPAAATELIQLSAAGRHEQALTMLSQFPRYLSAEEMASCIVHFREKSEDELADTLIRICGQEASQGAILVTMSRVLRRRNLHLDAETLLDLVV